jgi:hypothetical protein
MLIIAVNSFSQCLQENNYNVAHYHNMVHNVVKDQLVA